MNDNPFVFAPSYAHFEETPQSKAIIQNPPILQPEQEREFNRGERVIWHNGCRSIFEKPDIARSGKIPHVARCGGG